MLWARDIQVRKWITGWPDSRVIFDIPVHTLTTKDLKFEKTIIYPHHIEVIFTRDVKPEPKPDQVAPLGYKT